MPIPLACSCGRSLRIKDGLAGRRVRCPDCGRVLTVPQPEQEEKAEEEAVELLLADDPEEQITSRPPPRAEPLAMMQEEPPSPQPPGPAPPRSKARPKRKRDKSERRPRIAFEEGWFGSMDSGVVGGILMILIAVVWFVIGLWADRIFIYPPILVVIGLASIFKGLTGGE